MKQASPTKSQKKAFLLSIDLILTLIIIFSLLLPTLIQSSYASLLTTSHSKNAQKLSLLLQESQYIYSHGASIGKYYFDSSSLSGKNFSFVGFFDNGKFGSYAAGAGSRSSLLGFQSLAYSVSAPQKIAAKNQFCVQRKMLDSEKNIVDVWVCAT